MSTQVTQTINSGKVGKVAQNVGDNPPVRQGRGAEQVVTALHGKFYEAAYNGQVFSQSNTPLGGAIPIYTTTTPLGAVLWNPPGSGVNCELVHADVAYVSGTSDFGSIVLMALAGMPAAVATGAAMTAFAKTTPKNGLFGSGLGSGVFSSNAGTITITAGTATDIWQVLGEMNLQAQTGTAHATAPGIHHDFDGKCIVPPGVLVYIAATKASSALYNQTLVWAEHAI